MPEVISRPLLIPLKELCTKLQNIREKIYSCLVLIPVLLKTFYNFSYFVAIQCSKSALSNYENVRKSLSSV